MSMGLWPRLHATWTSVVMGPGSRSRSLSSGGASRRPVGSLVRDDVDFVPQISKANFSSVGSEKARFRFSKGSRRPCERRDPYAAPLVLRGPVRELSRNRSRLWLWVPAFAGTTTGSVARVDAVIASDAKQSISPRSKSGLLRRFRSSQ